MTIVVFVLGELTQNYSQVDKIWSIIPVVYCYATVYQQEKSFKILTQENYRRQLLMIVPITIWGIRLTLNFVRRGGYSIKFWTGEEDYRWPIIRNKPEFKNWSKIHWSAFNLFFISAYQMMLIWSITFPLIVVNFESQVTWVDYGLSALITILVILETIADQQQYDYQTEKYRLLALRSLNEAL